MILTRKTRSKGNLKLSSCTLRKALRSGWSSGHKNHGSNHKIGNSLAVAKNRDSRNAAYFTSDFFQCSGRGWSEHLVSVQAFFWRPLFRFVLPSRRDREVFRDAGRRYISRWYLGEKRGDKFALVCGVRNITLIFIEYFVDENKYIKGKCFYVRFPNITYEHSYNDNNNILIIIKI